MFSPQANYSMASVQNGQHDAVREYQLNPEQHQESTQQYQATAVQYQQSDQYQTNKPNEVQQQHQQSQQIYNCYKDNQYQAAGEMQQQQKSSQHEYQGLQTQCQQSQQCPQDQHQQSNQGLVEQCQQSIQRPLDQRPQQQQYQDTTQNSLENQCSIGNNASKHSFIIMLHGLPYSVNHEEIMKFLSGCSVAGGKEGVHIVYDNDGRLNGDAFIELSSEADVAEAMKKNRNNIGRRYIEVTVSDQHRMEFALKKGLSSSSSNNSSPVRLNDCIVRLRGLPYECCTEQVANFFLGLTIVPNGITLMTDHLGRTEREGFVQFASPDLIPKALEKHMGKIQHRYIEVYKSSLAEMHKKVGKASPWTGGRPGPYDRPGTFNGNFGNFGFGTAADFMGCLAGLLNGGLSSSFLAGGMGGFGREGGMEGWNNGGWSMGGTQNQMGSRGEGRIMEGEQFRSETGHFVLMRGLPYSATKQDIEKFFEPLSAVNIVLECNRNGRASGNAYVDFATYDDAKQAMSRHRATMQHRYIELYFMEMGGRSVRC